MKKKNWITGEKKLTNQEKYRVRIPLLSCSKKEIKEKISELKQYNEGMRLTHIIKKIK